MRVGQPLRPKYPRSKIKFCKFWRPWKAMQSIQWCLWLWRMDDFARSFEWKGRRRCHFWPLWLYLSVVTKVVTVDCDFKLAKFEEALDIPEVALDTDDRLLALVYLGTKGLSRTNMLNWQNFWKKIFRPFAHFSKEKDVFQTSITFEKPEKEYGFV